METVTQALVKSVIQKGREKQPLVVCSRGECPHHTPPLFNSNEDLNLQGSRQESRLKALSFSISKELYKLLSEPLPLQEWLILVRA